MARASDNNSGGTKAHPVQAHTSPSRHGAAVEARIRAALREGRLFLAFQPVVCSSTGKVDYFECLLRMRDEQGDIVAAASFVTTLEELGLIGMIDHYVLEKTFEELATDPEVRLGLNVSGLTVCDRSWLQLLTSLLRRRSDLAPRLVVEITETAALGDIAQTACFVDTLRQAGCRVALDDFGAGHTSLRHLRSLPVHIVKIDGSLIRQVTSRSHHRVFLRHLLCLSETCGLITVAESVESAEEAEWLRTEGVACLQGYFIGRPTIERSRKIHLMGAAGNVASPGSMTKT
jgi:EAL domain-containing protein (putative c-di-GMP-specific phosphodiesterase class I)